MDKNGNLYPSAFIPFCDLDGKVLGKKIMGLDMPVCNSFEEKFHNNQLCYEIDVNRFKNIVDPKQLFRHGLTFIVDVNRNRQINNYKKYNVLNKTLRIGKTWNLTYLH